ncbi:MAG: DUF4082 domain-containing protein [Microbispora sp.]|nr:DUF4082 domain-containing protein [Microbispora sp.]
MKHPRHGARPGYARAFRRLSRPRPVLLIATALAAAAVIPVISITTRSTESSVPDPAPAARPRMTLQARETGLWSPDDRSGPPVHADRAPLELGTRFTAAKDGWVTGVRFYKARGEKGRHTGSLWDSKGTRLATVTFKSESRSGWQEARFDEAVPVKAGKVYTISYHSEHGTYVGRPSSAPLRSGPLSTAPHRVGVYAYGPSRFPKQWNPKNYNYYVGPIYRWLERRPVPATHPSAGPSDEVAGSTPVPSVSLPSPEPSTELSSEPVTEPGAGASSSAGPSSAGPSPVEPSPVEPSVTPTPAGPSAEPSAGPSAGPSAAQSPSVRPSREHSGGTRPTAGASPSPAVPSGPGSGSGSGSGSGCDGGYPTPDCTGVPRSLEPLRQPLSLAGKDYVVTEPGAVVDGMHIPGDLVINADGVTVRNSQIDGTVINERGTRHYSFTISDSTVGPAKGCITAPGVGESHYTATRVLVRGHGDGFRVSGDDVTIRDSYVHLCSNPGDHSDGIQTYKAGRGLVFHHNTVDQRDARDITAPIFITDPNVVDVTLTDNLIMGGTYSIQVKNARGKVVVRGNRLVDRSWVYGPVEADCSSIDWSGNTLVTVDAHYRVTSTVGPLPCQT